MRQSSADSMLARVAGGCWGLLGVGRDDQLCSRGRGDAVMILKILWRQSLSVADVGGEIFN